MACDVCEMLKRKELLVYEDKDAAVLLPNAAVNAGHLLLVPKKHFTIVEQLPDSVVTELFSKARLALMVLFEALNCHGTNLLIQNGSAAGQKQPHLVFNLIPRWENDGLDLLWKPKQLSEEEMSTVELKLKEAAKDIGYFDNKEPKKKSTAAAGTAHKVVESVEGEENYLLKQLDRIP